MANPEPYSLGYSFSSWQASNPQKPPPGPSLDGELADVASSTVQLCAALADIRRDDGALKNGVVTAEALSGAVREQLGVGDLYGGFEMVADGGGVALSGGAAWDVSVPYACEIISVVVLAQEAGSMVIDLRACTVAQYPPTGANSITGGAPITIATSNTWSGSGAAIAAWAKTLAIDTVLRIYLVSASTTTKFTISVRVRRI